MSALTAGAIAAASIDKKLFGSWWFLTLSGTFLLNTLCCTVVQFRRAWGRWADGPPSVVAFRERRCMPVHLPAAEAREAAAALLQRRGYTVRQADDGNSLRLLARRRFWAVWGSPLFHTGLVLVILGGFVSLAISRWGSFGMLEGETFDDRSSDYVSVSRGPLAPLRDGRFSLTLRQIDLRFRPDGTILDFAAQVQLRQNGRVVRAATVDGANPLRYGSVNIYRHRFGYAPAFRLDRAGAETARFIVALDTVMPGINADTELKDSEVLYRGDFAVPGTPFRAVAEFFPDTGGDPGFPQLRSHLPKDPGLWIQVSGNGQDLYKGLVRPGEAARFGEYTLRFDHLRRWYGFAVVQDPGIPLVYLGFVLIVPGLVLIYLLSPREVTLRIRREGEGAVAELSGRSDRFPVLFREEFTAFADNLATILEQEVRDCAEVGDSAFVADSGVLHG